MSDKTLLGEAVTRRFMKLAKLEPLSENFFDEVNEEEELEEAGYAYQRDEEELAPEDEMAPDQMELEPEAEAPGEGPLDVMSLVDAIADAIEAETGVSVAVEDAGEEAAPEEMAPEEALPEEEPEMADELPLEEVSSEEEVSLEEETDQDLKEEEDLEEEAAPGRDDIVAELAKRVAQRLLHKK